MADYTSVHGKTLRRLEAKGAPVTFTRDDGGVYSPDGTWIGGGPQAVSGHAVEVPGDPAEYQSMELIGTDAITLMFAPSVMGELPGAGWHAAWSGATRTVRQVFPIRPDGTAILARVVLA